MSQHHTNLPWTESPFFEVELKKANLSDADKAFVRRFAEDGYVIIDPEIDEATIDTIVEQLAPGFAKITNGVIRIKDAWKFNKQVREVAVQEAVLKKLRLLCHQEPFPFQTLNFQAGTQQATCSDMLPFNALPHCFMCGVWVAFDDIDKTSGPTHALGLKKEVLKINKGQALIWSTNLLQGDEKILHEGAGRYSQVTHYYFENRMCYVPRLSDKAIKKLYFR